MSFGNRKYMKTKMIELAILFSLTSCSYEPLQTKEQYDYCRTLRKEQYDGQTEIYLPAYCFVNN